MSVDVIPQASEELKLVLFVNRKVNKFESLVRRKEKELKILERLEKRLNLTDDTTLSNFHSLAKGKLVAAQYSLGEWKKYQKVLPKVCSYCNGERSVDNSTSRMMARVCPSCGGSGLADRVLETPMSRELDRITKKLKIESLPKLKRSPKK